MAGDGEDDQNRAEPAGQHDDSPASDPASATDPDQAWEQWLKIRPVFEASLDRRVRTVQRGSAVLAVASAIVFVSAVVVDRRPPGVGLLWVIGGFAAAMALVGGSDHVRYQTAWARRTGTFSREDIERRGLPVQVAIGIYLRDSAKAIDGQERTFRLFLSGSIVAGLLWVLSALVLLG